MNLETEEGYNAYFREEAAQRMLDELSATLTQPAKRLCDLAAQLRALPYGCESTTMKLAALERIGNAWNSIAGDFISKGEILYVQVRHG